MSDTWSDIQAFKSRQSSLRERLQRRKKEREGIVLSITGELSGSGSPRSNSPIPNLQQTPKEETNIVTEFKINPEIEQNLLVCLCDVALNLPTDSRSLLSSVTKSLNIEIKHIVLENLLQKFAAQELITITESYTPEGKSCIVVSNIDHTKLQAFSHDLVATKSIKKNEDDNEKDKTPNEDEGKSKLPHKIKDGLKKGKNNDTIESLLSLPSTREKENKKLGEEILELLSKPTAKERSLVERFRSQGGAQVQEFCPHGTKEECMKVAGVSEPCKKLHFKKIIQKHTDESLGDCSFLNTCFHMDTCKYVHYEVDYSTVPPPPAKRVKLDKTIGNNDQLAVLYPSQWIQCDLRYFDMSILGKFAVVMADPPWDIHMELPYGTMSDDEMRRLNIPSLQDEGLIFLWVTGRAMELGRECLQLWGYERCDEIIWVKTNQLQRIIRTGRTGHWLNHGKEHCLVGIKGNPEDINRGLDCDVIVAEVRATSHKPDEIYGIIERLSPGTRKIELFGRPHNVQPNWITLGNQVEGVRLIDPTLIEAFRKCYPDGNCMKKLE
ncbi:N6-adenosine-methyltransferase catalytic subunit-like [Centruroides sculpturatus]|uniref:N6-adenosine-methyltransferase catalytic subunit-like n=1 Tax=Centruroides sculpturatus TaxID=218467 RepID=UPI000C6E3C63|nr:N6-adenosine-methyltransferase catalytic subunit-like [Centruroides sculpturatus]XP_023222307.1 N6-adenosine-methyltransferase catalytic subunit-like [Centruroides sculpturatus]